MENLIMFLEKCSHNPLICVPLTVILTCGVLRFFKKKPQEVHFIKDTKKVK